MPFFSIRVLKEYSMLDYLLQIIPTIADGLKVTIALFCVSYGYYLYLVVFILALCCDYLSFL